MCYRTKVFPENQPFRPWFLTYEVLSAAGDVDAFPEVGGIDPAPAEVEDALLIFSISHSLIFNRHDAVGHGVVHAVDAAGYLFQGEGHVDHAIAVGLFLVEEADAAVGLNGHGAVGRLAVADLESLVPGAGEEFGGVVVGGVGHQGLPPDAHVAAAAAPGQALQGYGVDVGVLAVDALGPDYQNLAVARVGSHGDAAFLLVALEAVAPLAGGEGVVGEAEDVEVAAIRLASAEHDVAVGQFLNLGLVAAGGGLHGGGAEQLPRLAEVVGIDHVGTADVVAATEHGGVEAVVVALLHLAALQYLAAGEEAAVAVDVVLRVAQQGAVGGKELAGDVLGFGPGLTAVVAAQAHHQWAPARRGAGVGHLAADADEHHLIALAVGHQGGIAKAVAKVGVVAGQSRHAVGNAFGLRPGLSVVVGAA